MSSDRSHNPPQDPLDPLALDPNDDPGSSRPATLTVRAAREPIGLTPDGRLKSGRLAGLSMRRAILLLSWPILAESFLNSLVGLTDTVLSAQISQSATDAIGGASYVMWFVGLIAMAVSVGITAIVSRAVGAGRMAVAHAAASQGLLLSVIGGLCTGTLLFAVAGSVASALNLSGQAADDFRTYLRIVALGVPAISITSAGIAAARAAGDSLRPLLSIVVVNIVNIGLSWMLAGRDYVVTRFEHGEPVRHVLLHNPSPVDMGVAGVAWGTVIGEYIGAIIILAMLLRRSSSIRIKSHRLRPHWHTIRRLLRIGLPNFLETFGLWAGNFLVVIMVGWIARTNGDGILGAHIVAVRIEAFSYLPGFAMGTAAATLCGQYLGAGSPAHAKRAILWCTIVACIFMGCAGAAFLLMPRQIVGLISSQPVHLALAPSLIFIAGFIQIPFGVSNVLRSALRGAGDTRSVMYIMWTCTYAVRLPLVYILSGVTIPYFGGVPNPFRSEPSLVWLWVALCSELVIRGVLFAVVFFRARWMHIRV